MTDRDDDRSRRDDPTAELQSEQAEIAELIRGSESASDADSRAAAREWLPPERES